MTFDERLVEFDRIRELLAGHAASQLGRTRIAEMHPTSERSELVPAITLVKEMMPLVESRHEPPVQGLRDVTNHLVKVRRQRAILEPLELLDLRDFLETATQVRRYFEPLQADLPTLHALAMPLQAVPALQRSIDEKIAPNATVRDSASELLSQLRQEISAVETQIQRELTRMVREFTDAGDLQDDFFTLRNDRYVLPVKTSNRGRIPGIIHDSSNTGETVFIEPFVILEHSNRLADLRLREREEVYRILLKVAGHVRDEINALLTDLDVLSEFDFVLAKARFGVAHRCAFPTLTDHERPVNLVNAHHPLLYVQNPEGSHALNLGLDTPDRVLVITGPNAGGKTTALKTIGLTAVMVQTAVPAPLDPRSRMPLFSDVLANIGDEQSILEGQSTFSAHVRRIAQILKASGGASLVLLDELGTATDPTEGGALAVAILESLVARNSLTVVSSHLTALKVWAHNHENGRNASFQLSDRDRRPTYRLTLDMIGISEALVVAEQVGLPPEVLERAQTLRPQGEGDATALLVSLKKKEEELAHQVSEAERLRIDLEDRHRELERAERELKQEKKTYRQRLLDQHERELMELRSRVEATIAKLPSKQDLLQAKAELQEEQRKAAELRAAAQAQDRRPDTTSTKKAIERGDRVLVRSLKEEGVVQSLDEARGQARVAVRNVVATVKLKELQPVAPSGRKEEAVATGSVHYRRPENPQSTLDLHGNRVDEALPKVEKFIDDALASGFSSIKLMHGQGSGALRRALHDFLRTYPVVSAYRFATPDEGGGGVTVVEFK